MVCSRTAFTGLSDMRSVFISLLGTCTFGDGNARKTIRKRLLICTYSFQQHTFFLKLAMFIYKHRVKDRMGSS